MDPLLALVIGLAIGLVIGSAVVWIVGGRSTTRWRAQAVALQGAVTMLRDDNEALRGQVRDNRSLDDLLQPVRESLDSLRRATDVASRDRTAAEATLTTQIVAVQERYQSLETATKQVAAALSRGQTRGQWGEMQLEGLLAL